MRVAPVIAREPSQSIASRPARTGVLGVWRLSVNRMMAKAEPDIGTDRELGWLIYGRERGITVQVEAPTP
jgi:hypothetical protein